MHKSTLKAVPIIDIEVGERFRKDFDVGKYEELKYSIKARGLISPICLFAQPKSEYPYLLLAGERRLRATIELGFDDINASIYETMLDSIELREVELYENLHRDKLTWGEEVALKKEIHDLQLEKRGEKRATGTAGEGASLRSTASLLGVSPATVSRDLRLAEAMEDIPELANAKSKAEAHKILDKKYQEELMAEYAKRQEAINVSTPEQGRKANLVNSFILMDFFKGVKKVPDRSIDFVEIDPPYALDLKELKMFSEKNSTGLEHYNEIDTSKYLTFLENTLTESHRVMKDNSWGVIWFAPEPWFQAVFEVIQLAGFKVRRIPLLWTKFHGQTQQPNYNLGNTYEMAFYFRKGNPTITKQGRSNVYKYATVAGQEKYHPTQRPIVLMEELLLTFCHPGARILVPFVGSGSTLLAASNKGMGAFGYDLSEEYKEAYTYRVHKGTPGKYVD